MAGTSPAMTTAVRSAIGNEADAKRADDYARVNKTDPGHLRKTRFTLTEQKKRDQLFVSAPARGGTTDPPLKSIEICIGRGTTLSQSPPIAINNINDLDAATPRNCKRSAMPPRLLNRGVGALRYLLKVSGIVTAKACRIGVARSFGFLLGE